MYTTIPSDPEAFLNYTWSDYQPYVDELKATQLKPGNLEAWMAAWSGLAETVDEQYNRLFVAHSSNTADAEVERRYNSFLDGVLPDSMQADQDLKQMLLASGLEPAGFAVQLRNMRAEADLFCEQNLPLLTEEQKLQAEYDKIYGGLTVTWEGKEVTIVQLDRVMREVDRARREQAFRLEMQRWQEARPAFNALWQRFLDLRLKLAANAGKPDYRSYRWQNMLRFDYTPEDCLRFHHAIEEVVVPAASRIYARRKQRLGVDTLRPWDLAVDPLSRPPLAPFQEVDALIGTAAHMFRRVDPQLGANFQVLMEHGLLDVANRKNKAPGAYCTAFARTGLPFIFGNAVGIHDDVDMLLHESGHAFHVFETAQLPYFPQRGYPSEFAEVASMGMELLASPYLADDEGGFYSQADAARAMEEHLEGIILFWPYMAVVDAFQQWVYTHPTQARDPHACDAQWASLWRRFMPGVDWSGLEDALETGWHRKQHIHTYPLYYVEYGLAVLGAVQVWGNALQDQAAAVSQYRQALALGGTRPLPDLYKAAGARLSFDAATLRTAITLLETNLLKLEEKD